MRRRAFLGLLGVSTASVLIPARTIFLPPRSRYPYAVDLFTGERVPIIQTMPYREPDPALFELLADVQRASGDICGVTEVWWRSPERGIYMQTRLHEADGPGRVMATYPWPRLEMPFA